MALSYWLRRKSVRSDKFAAFRRRRKPRRPMLESLEHRRVLAPVINEVHFNPLFGDGNQDQYVEIRGAANEVLSAGTYLVVVEGDAGENLGAVHTVFDLSGLQLGANGFLLLAQQGSNYAVDPGATLLKGTTSGFGGLRAATDPPATDRFSGSSTISNNIDFIVGSNTFFLIRTASAPDPIDDPFVAGDDRTDIDTSATPNGVPNGAAFASWAVLDAVSVLDGFGNGNSDVGYANLVFAAGGQGIKRPGAQVVNTNAVSWVGRNDDTTGSAPADWIAGQTQERSGNPFLFRLNNDSAFPPAFAGRNLDHVGAPNFSASIRGVVFHDANADGAKQAGEAGVAGATVYLDQNNNGVLDDFVTVFEPDNFPHQQVVQNRVAGVTLTVTGNNNAQFPEDTIPAEAVDDAARASTGVRVFAHFHIGFFNNDLRLRMDFYEPAKAISIDMIGDSSVTVGRLIAYNDAGVELETFETGFLAADQVGTMTIERPTAEIAYAVAYSKPDPNPDDGVNYSLFGRLDNLRFTQPERRTTTAADGSYEIPRVFAGDYAVRQVQQVGFLQTSPTGNGAHAVNLTDTSNLGGVDFGNRPNQTPVVEEQAFALDENSEAGATVGVVAASELDAGQTLSYEIVGGTGAELFTIDAANGEIRVAEGAELDFEAVSTYTIDVKVSDDAPAPSSTTAAMTIALNDVNEAPTEIMLSVTAVAEDTPAGPVATLSAVDLDAGATHVFSLIEGDDSGLFTIVGDQLILTPEAVLDHETRPALVVGIEVSDGEFTHQQMFEIQITNVNEAATRVTLSPGIVAEDADTTAPVLVGELATDDNDIGAAYTFELIEGDGDDDNSRFQISGSELILVLPEGELLDFETRQSYSVRVRATEGASTVETVLTVQVSDVNEPPQFGVLPSLNIAENSEAGASVGTFTAADPDPGQTLTYTLIGGDGAAVFTIGLLTGEVTLLDPAALDFETAASYTLEVRVADSGDPSLFEETSVTVEVINVDDAPTGVTLDGGAVSEDADTLSGPVVVGQLGVEAPNGGAGSTHVFALVAGEGDIDNDLFEIDGDQLRIKQDAALNFETQGVLLVRVSASNGVDPAAETAFIIDLGDVNEPPTDLTLSNATIPDTTTGPIDVGRIIADDPDLDGAFPDYVYTLEDGPGGLDNVFFEIDGDALRFVPRVGQPLKATYSVRLKADDGVHALNKVFLIDVSDVNDLPVVQDDTASTVKDQAVTIDVLANDDDPDGNLDSSTLTITVAPVNGTAVVTEGKIVYTPATGFVGQDTLHYTVKDNQDAISSEGIVTIDVLDGPPWQNPVLPADANGDGRGDVVDLLAVVRYLRDNPETLELTGAPGQQHARIDIDGNGLATLNDIRELVLFLRNQQENAEPEGEAPAASEPLLVFLADDSDDPWDRVLDEIAAG